MKYFQSQLLVLRGFLGFRFFQLWFSLTKKAYRDNMVYILGGAKPYKNVACGALGYVLDYIFATFHVFVGILKKDMENKRKVDC